MAVNITFRTQLLGGVHEFCTTANLSLFSNSLNLVELIVLLARYQEEGVSLCPKVYITNNISALTAMLPESERVKIGCSSHNPQGIKMALKKCAPLAIGGWCVYIQDNDTNIEFGVLKGSSNPIAVLMDDVILKNNDSFVVVKAFQIAGDCVEIVSSKGNIHYIFLNHRREESPPPLQFLDALTKSILEDIRPDLLEPTTGFLKRALFDALRESHGCIIAVSKTNNVPDFLSADGISLESSIDFQELIAGFKNDQIPASIIDSKTNLLKGMLNTDGIIVFSNKGCLLGYNCFVEIKKEHQGPGGARRRAFSSIGSEVGNEICAVFMQSQDGWTDFMGEKK